SEGSVLWRKKYVPNHRFKHSEARNFFREVRISKNTVGGGVNCMDVPRDEFAKGALVSAFNKLPQQLVVVHVLTDISPQGPECNRFNWASALGLVNRCRMNC